MNKLTRKIGFLGSGQMATALVQGFVNQPYISADDVVGYDISAAARDRFTQATGVEAVADLAELVQSVEFLFVAVKPQIFPEIAADIAAALDAKTVVVSIMAGTTQSTLQNSLSGHEKLIRIMPNTPALVGAGAAGMTCSKSVDAAEKDLVLKLMNGSGLCHDVPERLMDAVTGLSGSGPAYVFQFIEALSDGGVLAGLPRQIATELAAQTVLGAARMVLETGKHPGELKDAVASPGGTTITGLATLESHGLRHATISAVQAAAAKSRELGQG